MSILQEHKEVLLMESENKTLPEWVLFFDNKYTKNQIYGFCHRNGKTIKKISEIEKDLIQNEAIKKCGSINKDYFKTWSQEMAYILGFWWARGCVYNGHLFDITIHKKDKYIIKKIAEQLGYEGPQQDFVDRQVSRINFSCKTICDDLLRISGEKSEFPQIPQDYLSDFIRGYFDGNGYVVCHKGGGIVSTFTSGSKTFLAQLLEHLQREAGVETGTYDAVECALHFGKKDTLKIGKYMYKNNSDLFLLRKQEKFIVL